MSISVKIILILLAVIIAMGVSVAIMCYLIKAKNKKIKLLTSSLNAQRELVRKSNSIKSSADKKKKKLETGSNQDKFEQSLGVLSELNTKDDGDEE